MGMMMDRIYLIKTNFGHYRICASSADEALAKANLMLLHLEKILSVVEA
jgi:hypothetical protein